MRNRPLCGVCLIFFLLFAAGIHVGKEKLIKELRPSPLEQCVGEGEEISLAGCLYKREIKDKYQVLYLKNNSISHQEQSLEESRILVYEDKITEVHIGQELQVEGKVSFFESARNPGNFDRKLYYQKQDIHASVWALKLKIIDGRILYPAEFLYKFRQRWKSVLTKAMGKEKGGALAAMLLGEKGDMDEELKELYQVNGIGHILAISGLHLSFIGIGIYQIFRRITGSYPIGGAVGILFLSIYILMIGFTVSAVRALVMFLFRVGADITGRHYDSPTALAVSAAVVLLWRPLYLYDGGFWLSFGAVLAVIAVLPVFRALPVQGLWASISINLVIFPVLLYYFYEFPLYSVVLNLLVIPLMSVLLFLGIFGSLLFVLAASADVLIFVGMGMLKLCAIILCLYEKCCAIMLRIPGARIVTGQPEFWQIAVYYLLLLAAVLVWRRRKRQMSGERAEEKTKEKTENKAEDKWRQWRLSSKRCCAYAVLLVCLGSALLPSRFGESGGLSITMLDVGQGDGIFMRGPQGVTYFVDGGSSDVKGVGRYRIEPFLKSQGVRKLDYVFISHGDSDHMNGISEMLGRWETGIEIGTLVFPVETVWDDGLKELAKEAVEHGVRVAVIEPGQELAEGQLHIACIQPGEEYMGEKGNAASMVLAVTCGEFDMLFTGDVEGEGEEVLTDMLKEGYADRSWEILKTAHHGSKNSSAEEFLGTVKPMYAMISAGKENRYGHPHVETVERLEAAGSKIYSTQECGAVGIEVKGNEMRIWRYLCGTGVNYAEGNR